jgi:hypothetical protein
MAVLKNTIEQIKEELDIIDQEWVDVPGGKIEAGQCYHFESDPPHLLFNLNCPESLQKKLKDIISKYLPPDENGTSQ